MMRKMIGSILGIWIGILSVVSAVQADSPKSYSDPVTMLREVSDQMIQAVKINKPRFASDPFLSDHLVRKYLLPYVDRLRVAKLITLRYWQGTTAAQQDALMEELTFAVIHTYSSAIESYDDQKVDFYDNTQSLGQDADGHNQVSVQGCFHTKDIPDCSSGSSADQNAPVSLEFRLVQENNTWMVYDVIVENVSVIQSYRSQYADTLASGGVASLIEKLKAHNDEIRDGKN